MECSLCAEAWDRNQRLPKKLPCCSQSCCLSCLSTLLGNPCPFCRTELPAAPSDIPDNQFLLESLQAREEGRSLRLCSECGVFCEWVCDTCGLDAKFCRSCGRAHTAKAAFFLHKIIRIEDMPLCRRHGRQSELWCLSCDALVCIRLCLSSLHHFNHETLPIDAAAYRLNGKITQKKTDIVPQKLVDQSVEQIRALQEMKTKFTEDIEKCRQEITSTYGRWREKIDDAEKESLNQLDSISEPIFVEIAEREAIFQNLAESARDLDQEVENKHNEYPHKFLQNRSHLVKVFDENLCLYQKLSKFSLPILSFHPKTLYFEGERTLNQEHVNPSSSPPRSRRLDRHSKRYFVSAPDPAEPNPLSSFADVLHNALDPNKLNNPPPPSSASSS